MVELHGHRGARGLHPENTLEGCRAAIAIGVDFLEIDVGLSRDGHVIIHHDHALNAAATRQNGRWIETSLPIRSLSAAELAAYDVGRLRPGSAYASKFPDQVASDGVRIPTLAQLLLLPELVASSNTRLNIEIKTSPEAPNETAPPDVLCEALLNVIDLHKARSRCRVQSFDWRNLVYLHEAAPDLELGFLTSETVSSIRQIDGERSPWFAGLDGAFDGTIEPVMDAIHGAGGQFWGPNFEDVTVDEVAAAHRHGLKVNVWTVNEIADIQRMLAFGVDAITTDYPDRARRLFEARDTTQS